MGIDGAQQGDAAAGLVGVEESGELKLRDERFNMCSYVGGCC